MLAEKDKELARLLKLAEQKSTVFTQQKEEPVRLFHADKFSEFDTRKMFFGVALASYGWLLGDDCQEEVEVTDMEEISGQKTM